MSGSTNSRAYAQLETISYTGLLARKSSSMQRLESACKHDGFFYLDLSGIDSYCFIRFACLEGAAGRFFDLDLNEKMQFDTDKLSLHNNHGYKPTGRNSGLLMGEHDEYEIFLVPRDVILKQDTYLDGGPPYSAYFHKYWPSMKEFSRDSNEIARTVLAGLSNVLRCGPYPFQHDPDRPSTSTTALIKYPAQDFDARQEGGHMAHTDAGTLSLLFSSQDGLQVSRSGAEDENAEWLYIKPIEECAVVIVGDSLRYMSGNTLKSSYHRVLPDQDTDLYLVIYFLGPQTDAKFTDKDGKEWKSIDYHKRKFDAFR